MEIQTLFEEYRIADNERTTYPIKANGWDEKREALYINGVVLGKLRERDKHTMQFLDEDYPENLIVSKIKKCLLNKSELVKNHTIYDLENISLDDCIEKYFSGIFNLIKDAVDGNKRQRNALYLYYAYEEFCSEIQKPYYEKQDEIQKVYGDLFEFKKYELIEVTDSRKLFVSAYDTRLYDIEKDITLSLVNLPKNILLVFNEMISNKMIGKLSVRLSNNYIWQGKYKMDTALEAVEFGKKFSLDKFPSVSLTKLYSSNLGDSLWIRINGSNIIFEELQDNIEIQGDDILTQIVHLEYYYAAPKYYIKHMDHEFIFYTLEEYEKRLSDSTQKGKARKRIKTFKIDNSAIPIDYYVNSEYKKDNGEDIEKQKVLFLFFVLEHYFKHLDLLNEYFEDVCN